MERRIASIVVCALAVIAGLSLPANAEGVWDPNDTTGRLDIRWVGASYTASGELHVSVSFYGRFEPRLLPRRGREGRSHVGIRLSAALDSTFVRSHGRLVFIWGDFGSSCCAGAPVRRPSSNVLSVTFDPCSYGYGEEIDLAKGESSWRTRAVEAMDETGEMRLRHPECGTGG